MDSNSAPSKMLRGTGQSCCGFPVSRLLFKIGLMIVVSWGRVNDRREEGGILRGEKRGKQEGWGRKPCGYRRTECAKKGTVYEQALSPRKHWRKREAVKSACAKLCGK